MPDSGMTWERAPVIVVIIFFIIFLTIFFSRLVRCDRVYPTTVYRNDDIDIIFGGLDIVHSRPNYAFAYIIEERR